MADDSAGGTSSPEMEMDGQPRRFRRGLVMGKFWPPHNGHLHLIDHACAM